MERSLEIGGLISALAKAQTEFTPALKESNNPFYSSKYADLATVIDAVRPALNKNGIAMVQFNSSDLERQTATVTTTLFHGEQFISEIMEAPAIGKAKDGKDKFDVQTLGAAWSYLRRYGIQSICGLASEDDDGNSLQNDNKPVARRTTPAQALSWKDEPAPQPEPILQHDERPDPDLWRNEFDMCESVELFNTNVIPRMKERGREFIIAASTEAKRRGYKPNRITGLYEVAK